MASQADKYRTKGHFLDDQFFNTRFLDIDARLNALEVGFAEIIDISDELVERGLEVLDQVVGQAVAQLQISVNQLEAQLVDVEEAFNEIISGGGLSASSIPISSVVGLDASDVQAALEELATEKANAADLTAQLVDFTPAGSITSSNVQDAIEELDDEKAAASITLTAGNGLTGGGDLSTDRSFAVGQGTGIVVGADDVAIDKATDANVRAAASNKVLTADLIESASAAVALTDNTTVSVDWEAGFYFTLTITNNRTLGNPSNGHPGTWRYIRVQGNSGTNRTLSFGNQYVNQLPTLTDIDSGQPYLLMIFCHTTSQFYVWAQKAANF